MDTNICIYYIKGLYDLDKKFERLEPQNCYISEITLAELKFGVENSEKREKNLKVLEKFLSGITVIPIFHALDIYAKEKSRLRKSGTPIDDFDLLIGATAVHHSLIMVTNNSSEFKRIKGVVIENWVDLH